MEDFSSGYYRTRMNVQNYDDGPVIERQLYEFINSELYDRSSQDVMMRVGLDATPLFTVSSEAAVPRDVLALPEEMGLESGLHNVFVLKSEYSETVGRYHG
jgi:hypothetical protein